MVPPQIPEPEPARRRMLDRAAGCPRHQDLPAVPGRADPGGGMHRQPDIACVGQGRLAAVDPDANADLDAVSGTIATESVELVHHGIRRQ